MSSARASIMALWRDVSTLCPRTSTAWESSHKDVRRWSKRARSVLASVSIKLLLRNTRNMSTWQKSSSKKKRNNWPMSSTSRPTHTALRISSSSEWDRVCRLMHRLKIMQRWVIFELDRPPRIQDLESWTSWHRWQRDTQSVELVPG